MVWHKKKLITKEDIKCIYYMIVAGFNEAYFNYSKKGFLCPLSNTFTVQILWNMSEIIWDQSHWKQLQHFENNI